MMTEIAVIYRFDAKASNSDFTIDLVFTLDASTCEIVNMPVKAVKLF